MLYEKGWLDDLHEQIPSRNIRLYRRKDKKDPQNSLVVLPLADNRGALLLVRDEDDYDYFVCVGIYPHRVRPVEQAAAYHELPEDVECKVIQEDEDVGDYLGDAIDCDELERDIAQKKIWNPALGAEGEKWRAYLNLSEEALTSRGFGVPVRNIEMGKGVMKATLSFNDGDEHGVSDKVYNARGVEVRFALLPGGVEAKGEGADMGILGKIRDFDKGGKSVRIDLDAKYANSLPERIRNGKFFTGSHKTDGGARGGDKSKGGEPRGRDGMPAMIEFKRLPKGTPQHVFYYDNKNSKPAFSCAAKRMVAPTPAEVDLNLWLVDPESIKMRRMMLFADFFGDKIQIDIMRRGLRKITTTDIWRVLSEEDVAKLPEPFDVDWGGDCRLDPQQREAVQKALGAPELCLIWGPPGTGKTEVIKEIAKQEVLRGGKILIASQANLAVDNALARLHGAKDVWPLRISKGGYELETEDENTVPTKETAGFFFSRWLRKNVHESKPTGNNADDKLRGAFAERLKSMKPQQGRSGRDMPQMAELYRRRINVVGATLMESGKGGTIPRASGIEKFDTVIVDEVSKATPPELFLPAALGGRLVLVGDHKQLPPMFNDDLSLEEWAEKAEIPLENLDIEPTLFQRLWERHLELPNAPVAKLTVQYRMHRKIQGLVEQFYQGSGGALECGLSEDKMAKMSIAESGFFAGRHAVWVNTDANAVEENAGTSFVNNSEIRIVRKLLAALPHGKNLSVGVITFYGAQLAKLRRECGDFSRKFPGKLIFGTVDRFQGRECDVVICSLVRNNKQRKIGFAQKPNRINVAFSRARKLLCIVGNSGHFCSARSASARDAYKRVCKQCDIQSESDVAKAIEDAWGSHSEKRGVNNVKK